MDPEVQKQLNEIRALAKENHRILRAMRRDQRLAAVGKVIFWIIVFAAPFYLYQQYVQPIVQKFSANPSAATSALTGIPTTTQLQNLLHSYQAGQ